MFDAPVVSVHIPPSLRSFAGGHDEIVASGDTVGELLAAVGREYPAILAHLTAGEGRLQAGIDLYLGGQVVDAADGLTTPVDQAEVLSIVSRGG